MIIVITSFLLGTSKNASFGIWSNLSLYKFVMKKPQYTKYPAFFITFSGMKSFAQILKKEFLEVAC